MSTKTLRKRIALVAVAGLGFGLLSATTASATGYTVADVTIATPTAGSIAAVGVCAIDATAQDNSTALSTGTAVKVGASLSFDTTGGSGTLSISGPATWTSAPDGSVNATATKLTDATTGSVTLSTSAAGTVTVTVKDDDGVSVRAFSIAVVASCSSSTAPVAANTLLSIGASLTSATATDVTMAYASVDYDSTVFVNITLLNGYKGAVSAGLLTATATNGALITFDPSADPLTSTAFASTAATPGAVALRVHQDTDTNPGKALTTTITFAFNGETVGTKTVTILGQAASLTVSKVVGGISGADGTFEYITQDNAGNSVESPASGSITGTIAGWKAGDVLSALTATSDYDADSGKSSFTTKGTGKFTCKTAGTKSSGSVDVAIGFLDGALNLVKSNTFAAACGQGVDTFTIGLDKAIYSTGEIATATITAKDKLGFAVGDNTTVGAAIALDLGGMTIIGSVATTDKFAGGIKTYKFRVDQNLGSFVGQGKITAVTDTSAKTVQYKIVASDSGTSLNDVLKAMVSLIASINKQIAALQKALLKKK